MSLSPAMNTLIDALAAAEVAAYLAAQTAPANDPSGQRSDHPASDTPAQAA